MRKLVSVVLLLMAMFAFMVSALPAFADQMEPGGNILVGLTGEISADSMAVKTECKSVETAIAIDTTYLIASCTIPRHSTGWGFYAAHVGKYIVSGDGQYIGRTVNVTTFTGFSALKWSRKTGGHGATASAVFGKPKVIDI